jgi:hypothetical protein
MSLAVTKVPDATPGVVAQYALNAKQARLAKLRYNRLGDDFVGIACHSLPGLGRMESDEIYLGVGKKSGRYVFPVRVKSGRGGLDTMQVEQDLAMCARKFPGFICRALGAPMMADGVIAMFEFEETCDGIRIGEERHFQWTAAGRGLPAGW